MLPISVLKALASVLAGLPAWLVRRLAGPPIRVDGQQLAAEAQLMLKFVRADRDVSVAAGRRNLRALAAMTGGRGVEPVTARDETIPTGAGPLRARLYRPGGPDVPGGPLPLLVYLHGGGWVQGDLETHDNVCRFLALHGGVAVLAVDYRLAPEHPFPAAVNDCLAAFRHAVAHAAELGADPSAIAIGGDSAGGNLAAVVSRLTAGDDVRPVFQLLIYPGTDAVEKSRSRSLFAEGFFLTDERIEWFLDQYLPDHDDRADPRASPLREPAMAGLPPAYVCTAGFDPLRDEGEELAARLRAAGTPVALRRFPDLYHGFANVFGISARSREAMHEIASALRTGVALRADVRADTTAGAPADVPAGDPAGGAAGGSAGDPVR